MKILIAAAFCLFAQSFGFAQDKDSTAAPTSVKEIDWLVGTWNGPEKLTITSVIGAKFIQIDVDHKDASDRHMIGFDPAKKGLALWFFGQDGSTGNCTLAASSTKDVLVWEGTINAKEMSVEFRWTLKRTGADEILASTELKSEGAWKMRGSSKYRRGGVDRSTPKSLIEAALETMKTPDVAALQALMTPECVATEKEEKKSFSNALAKGIKLIKADIREPVIDGDKATITAKAKFKMPEGDEDGESLRFVLVKKEGAWWITELK